jgi:hypothetical protein
MKRRVAFSLLQIHTFDRRVPVRQKDFEPTLFLAA